jgi:hypothetical protein
MLSAENLTKSYRVAASADLVLMVEHDVTPIGPVLAFVMPIEQVEPDFTGERFCYSFLLVRNDAEALEWFEEVAVTRPWLVRN